VVIQSPFTTPALADLRLSVDWYSIKVKDAIGAQSVAIALRQCFDPALNPLVTSDPAAAANSPFCQNVPRNANGGLGNVQTTFVNNGRFEVSGIDGQLDWGLDVGPGRVNANVIVNYMLDFKSAELPVLPLIDYVGTQGTTENGLNSGAYEYRILGTLGYSLGGASLSLQWQHLPSIEDTSEAQFGPTPTEGAPSYNLFNLRGTYAVNDTVNLRFGVDNLFNKEPPLVGRNPSANPATGNLPNGSFSADFYDTIGRRFYVGANLRF
jgi:outer membrane receptor protein involved in Fe transport